VRPIALAAVACAALSAAPGAAPGPQAPYEQAGAPAPRNRIDELVFGRLARLGIAPAALSPDAVFIRRAFLDVTGTLPAAEEVWAFLSDTSPGKRAALVDRLLARDEYADYGAMKWGETLRVKSEFPINLWPNAAQAYHRWIRASLRDNQPYDRFARALLTASGSNFRVPPVNFYRAVQSREPTALAQAVALTLMGARAEKWPADRLSGMAAFFSAVGYKPTGEWKEEIVYFKPAAGSQAGVPKAAVLPDGTTATIRPDQDPREVFAAWLVSPSNAWFTRAIANRVWFWLVGRGIVHEPDDIRPDNPPIHPELLAYLERELIESQYDLKHLHRLILNSATYQLSPVVRPGSPDAERNFAVALVRPLEAEVLVDALNQITGTTSEYSSAIPEPFTFAPTGQRAVALADGSITSPFLETFGRPARDTGLALERAGRPTAASRLYLLNSTEVQRKLEQGPRVLAIIQMPGTIRQLATRLYLTILSRLPTEPELRAVEAYAQATGNRRAAGVDLAWALVNSVEFLFRH
jgi:hypothetical protein